MAPPRCIGALAATLGLLALPAFAEEHWAVLIAGSSGYFNYRHQADVCHAYHLLTSRGFKPENIITMLFDDVAKSEDNPLKGKLFNYPFTSMDKAVDVYKGCKIDYRGSKVTPDDFVAVLTGNATKARGKVLKSTADDHVFVNFVDHGGVGIIAFPNDGHVLHATRLVQTLQTMHDKGMYKQLTFYLETCESGSMFENVLPADLPVYALTAANAEESSWGTYCGDDAVVNGTRLGTCLGDLFSVNWMMDSESDADGKETIGTQFETVRNLTNKSHVMQYGQVGNFSDELVSDFQGPVKRRVFAGKAAPVGAARRAAASAVRSRDIKLDQLYRDYVREGTAEASERLVQEIQARQAVEDMRSSLHVAVLGSRESVAPSSGAVSWSPALLACHEQAVEAFGRGCGWTEGRLTLSRTLHDLCLRTGSDAAPIRAGISRACAPAFYA